MSNEFNPSKSMFGKHRYGLEQSILRSVQNDTDKAMAMVDPHILKINLPIITSFPFEKRREVAIKRLNRSIQLLKEMGV
ncbi:MAG: hypothetical protein DRN81_02015 [Thermoproteota archaeon]|nr:MAG: hypothetical protein DRN81_02015 [Candidatus Korarchaeota archaeon]